MKLFVLVSRVPYPLEKGDKLRAYHQIKRLSEKHEVFLCCLNDDKVSDEAREHLKSICSRAEIIDLSTWTIPFKLMFGLFGREPFQVSYFYQRSAQKKIDEFIDSFQPDHIYCQLVRTTKYVKHRFECRKTLDYMDTLSKGMERRTNNAPFYFKYLFKTETKRLIGYENLMFEYFDNCTIISQQDRELVYHSERKNISIIPNGVDTDFFMPIEMEKTHDLVFTGNMNYPPNVDSVEYLIENILPLIHKERPKTTLLISGVNPAKKVLAMANANENVTVTGWVKDIRSSYACSRIFLAPMQIGTGLQNKLLEAMAMNIPCITSELANNAIGAEPGVSILIGEDEQDYADKVLHLLDHKELRGSIARKGLELVRNKFNWDATTKRLESLMFNNDRKEQALVNEGVQERNA